MTMAISDPKSTSTIESFISSGDAISMSYDKFAFKERFDNIEFPIQNVLDDYLDEIKAQAKRVTLSDNQLLRYKYRPKLLANDVYKNSELDFVIMALNGICNEKEFDMKELYLLHIDDMDDLLTTILNAEQENLDIYNSRLT